LLRRLAAVGAVALGGLTGSGAGVFAAGVALFRRKCSLVENATGTEVAFAAAEASSDTAVEHRRECGRMAAGGVGVCETLRMAVAEIGVEVLAGGADADVDALDPVGEGVGVGFLEVLDGAMSFIGKLVVALCAAARVVFVDGPEAISIFVSTGVNLFVRRLFDAGRVAPATALESVFWVDVAVSIAAGSSDFLFFGLLDFSFSLAGTLERAGELPTAPEAPLFGSTGLENKLLKVDPISPKRLAANSASAAASAACSLAMVSRFSFFASFNFMPRLLSLVSSGPVNSKASLFRVSFPGT